MHTRIWAKKIWSFQHVKDRKLNWANDSSSKRMFKMPALARMHALRRLSHSLIALSKIFWSKRFHSFRIRCLRWSTSCRPRPLCKFDNHALEDTPYLIVQWTRIRAIGRPKCWWNKLWSFSWKHAERQFLWLDEQEHCPAGVRKIHCPTIL